MSEGPVVRFEPLPYAARLSLRALEDIDLVVVHCTELPDLATARRFGEQVHYPQSQTGNSGHFYIDRDGATYQYVPLERSAHHTRGYNARSVGIELVNTGRYPDWLDSRHQAMDEQYTPKQIAALIALLLDLQAKLPALRWIAGHEDLDTTLVQASDDPGRSVRRKRDPGPRFPWPRVCAEIALARFDPDAHG
ncbi:MAG: N-acetylmuramoyl-L-alanine amidase [Luteimonas sp.]